MGVTMKTIWKQQLQAIDVQTVDMPVGSQILCVQAQREQPCIWFINPDSVSADTEQRTFRIIGTGHKFDIEPKDLYIGTFQLHGGDLVFHVFEIIKENDDDGRKA